MKGNVTLCHERIRRSARRRSSNRTEVLADIFNGLLTKNCPTCSTLFQQRHLERSAVKQVSEEQGNTYDEDAVKLQ